jgi:uncharacterized protein (TIGR03083 family)
MPTRQELILKRLTDEGRKTAAYFRGLTETDFSQQVYTTGPGWRAHDLLAHVVSAERTFEPYLRDILAGGPGAPEDFDIDAYNAAETAKLKEFPAADLIRHFESARGVVIQLVRGMSDDDFDRVGRHPWFGRTALENMLKLIYRHTMLHERDIRKAIETGQPVPHVEARPPSAGN